MKIASFFLLMLLLVSCGNSEKEGETIYIDKQSEANLKVLYTSMSSLEFEVVYELGAEPYAGNRMNGRPYWDLLEDNVKEVFKERDGQFTLVVPKSLAQMRALPDFEKSAWTIDELLALEKGYRQTTNSGNQGSIFVVFVNGYIIQNGMTNPNIVGANIAGTTMVVIFKDVIKSVENGSSNATAKFMEQSTLIHEFGHVVGLVNAGVAMNTDHQDEAHGHHCDNTQCVMYWKNEGKSDLINFVQQFMLSGSNIMFDQNCLDDAKNYSK